MYKKQGRIHESLMNSHYKAFLVGVVKFQATSPVTNAFHKISHASRRSKFKLDVTSIVVRVRSTISKGIPDLFSPELSSV